LEAPAPVPGRLERVTELSAGTPADQSRLPFGFFIDYAHTDDALQNVLRTLRPLTAGRLIVVFGCGGDRDRTKRPVMGATAARLADFVIVTSDNPRSEDPAFIAGEIVPGICHANDAARKATPYEVHLDRGDALRRAVTIATSGDVVLVAGKGHETYQIFKDRTELFDDRAVTRALLAERVALGGA
jgi:UDP-N-acetylmuramyl tripeptide synthase